MAKTKCTCDTRLPEDSRCPTHPKRERIRPWIARKPEGTRAQIIQLPSKESTRTRLDMRYRIVRDES